MAPPADESTAAPVPQRRRREPAEHAGGEEGRPRRERPKATREGRRRSGDLSSSGGDSEKRRRERRQQATTHAQNAGSSSAGEKKHSNEPVSLPRHVDAFLAEVGVAYPFLTDPDFQEVPFALQLINSPGGRSLQAIEEMLEHVEPCLDAVVADHHESLNNAVQFYAEANGGLNSLLTSLDRVRKQLVEAKENLNLRHFDLLGLWSKSLCHTEMIRIIELVGGLMQLPSTVETLMASKRYSSAATQLLDGLRIIKGPDCGHIGALDDLRKNLSAMSERLFNSILCDISNHVYLKSPFAEDRWTFFLRRRLYQRSVDSNEDLNEWLSNVNGKRQLASGLNRSKDDKGAKNESAESLASISPTGQKNSDKQATLSDNIFSKETEVDCYEDNVELDSLSFIKICLESLALSGNLAVGLQRIRQQIPTEIFALVEHTISEFKQGEWSYIAAESDSSLRAKFMRAFCRTMYAKLEYVMETHHLICNLVQAIANRDTEMQNSAMNLLEHSGSTNVLQKSSDKQQSSAQVLSTAAYSTKEVWEAVLGEVRSILIDHLSSSSGCSQQHVPSDFLKSSRATDQLFRFTKSSLSQSMRGVYEEHMSEICGLSAMTLPTLGFSSQPQPFAVAFASTDGAILKAGIAANIQDPFSTEKVLKHSRLCEPDPEFISVVYLPTLEFINRMAAQANRNKEESPDLSPDYEKNADTVHKFSTKGSESTSPQRPGKSSNVASPASEESINSPPGRKGSTDSSKQEVGHRAFRFLGKDAFLDDFVANTYIPSIEVKVQNYMQKYIHAPDGFLVYENGLMQSAPCLLRLVSSLVDTILSVPFHKSDYIRMILMVLSRYLEKCQSVYQMAVTANYDQDVQWCVSRQWLENEELKALLTSSAYFESGNDTREAVLERQNLLNRGELQAQEVLLQIHLTNYRSLQRAELITERKSLEQLAYLRSTMRWFAASVCRLFGLKKNSKHGKSSSGKDSTEFISSDQDVRVVENGESNDINENSSKEEALGDSFKSQGGMLPSVKRLSGLAAQSNRPGAPKIHGLNIDDDDQLLIDNVAKGAVEVEHSDDENVVDTDDSDGSEDEDSGEDDDDEMGLGKRRSCSDDEPLSRVFSTRGVSSSGKKLHRRFRHGSLRSICSEVSSDRMRDISEAVGLFHDAADVALVTLRLELRSHIMYYLDLAMREGCYVLEAGVHDPDSYVLQLNTTMCMFEEVLCKSGCSHNDCVFVFEGAPLLMAHLLVSNASYLRRMNLAGAQKLVKSIRALYQNHLNTGFCSEARLEHARKYYELYEVGAEGLIQGIEANGQTYTAEEYITMLGFIYDIKHVTEQLRSDDAAASEAARKAIKEYEDSVSRVRKLLPENEKQKEDSA